MGSHVVAADRYARDVVQGRRRECKWVQLACKRYLRDREEARRPGGRWTFNAEWAETVCEFIELLPHVKGEWAANGELIQLQPWQSFVVVNIFGFLTEDGVRRFRRAYIEVPRKNGKSLLAAAIALVMYLIDGEASPEIFSGATTKKQAKMVFEPARQMVRMVPELREAFNLEVNVESLVLPDGGRFEPLVGRPGDGASPSCAIVDEYHEHKTDELREAMATGMKARRQPLLLIITTAGFNLESPCARQNAEAKQILEGVIEDEQTFTIIWTIDDGDDWRTEDALRKANPNYGISVNAEQLLDDLREALNTPSKAAAYKTKHLNIWVRAGTPFFSLDAWRELAEPIRLEDVAHLPCIVGGDLASKRDLAALVMMFKREDGTFLIVPRFYLNRARVEEVKTVPYEQWGEQRGPDGQPWLTITEGNITDYRRIEEDLLKLKGQVTITEMALDPHDATQLISNLREAGLNVIDFQQSTTNLSEPMQQLDADIMAGQLRHDGNPVMTFCISNTQAKRWGNKKVRPVKEREESKIDGAVAAIMARGRWMARDAEPEPPKPWWEQEESFA